MDAQTLNELNKKIAAREPAATLTHMTTGKQRLIALDRLNQSEPLFELIQQACAKNRSGILKTTDNEEHFLSLYLPSPRLLIIGAVHISQHLAAMARMLDFEVRIVDPRTAFATPARFPDMQLYAEWPQEIWEKIKPDAYTAVVALTHDPKIDDWPLMEALKLGCFYVGALGSRKTHAGRVERLQRAALSEKEIARIHAPIGLDIGAQSPAEIALAIAAQIIADLRITL